jgi:hypothetical protein
MKKNSTIYYIGAALLIYLIYDKYYKKSQPVLIPPTNIDAMTSQVSPQEQLAAPSGLNDIQSKYNLSYSINGMHKIKGIPSTI